MRVRLTVKLAEMVEGVDLSHCAEGDVVELSEDDATLLIRGGWAERVAGEERIACIPRHRRDIAADRTS
jgi:hypothetical protein